MPFFRVHYLWIDNAFELKFGAGASSKSFKKAVERNRIKRLIREAYRLQKNSLKNLLAKKKLGLALFVIYNGKALPEYNVVYEKMEVILQKLIKIAGEKNPSNT